MSFKIQQQAMVDRRDRLLREAEYYKTHIKVIHETVMKLNSRIKILGDGHEITNREP